MVSLLRCADASGRVREAEARVEEGEGPLRRDRRLCFVSSHGSPQLQPEGERRTPLFSLFQMAFIP